MPNLPSGSFTLRLILYSPGGVLVLALMVNRGVILSAFITPVTCAVKVGLVWP